MTWATKLRKISNAIDQSGNPFMLDGQQFLLCVSNIEQDPGYVQPSLAKSWLIIAEFTLNLYWIEKMWKRNY